MRGARAVREAPDDERFGATVRLRPRKALPSLAEMSQQAREQAPPLPRQQSEAGNAAIPDEQRRSAWATRKQEDKRQVRHEKASGFEP